MNASFVVLGLTMLTGAVLVGRALAGGRLARVGFACMGAAGAGTVIVGLFPENTIAGVHAAGAGLPFVLGNGGLVLLGTGLPGLPVGLRVGTCLAGAVGLAGLPLFLSHAYLGLGIGGMERVTAYPQDIWLVVFGAYLLMRSTDHRDVGSG